MDHWVETPYGKRYKEDHGTSIAFFMTAPNENGKREIPEDVVHNILEEYMDRSKRIEEE